MLGYQLIKIDVKKARKERILHLKGLDDKAFKGSPLEGEKGKKSGMITIEDTLPGHRAKGMKV